MGSICSTRFRFHRVVSPRQPTKVLSGNRLDGVSESSHIKLLRHQQSSEKICFYCLSRLRIASNWYCIRRHCYHRLTIDKCVVVSITATVSSPSALEADSNSIQYNRWTVQWIKLPPIIRNGWKFPHRLMFTRDELEAAAAFFSGSKQTVERCGWWGGN